MTRGTMTRAVAEGKAKRQLSFGYYRVGPITVMVRCPDCEAKVTVELYAPEAERLKALRIRLRDHLLNNCDKED